MHVLAMEGEVCWMRRICCNIYHDLSASSHEVSSAAGLSQSAVWCTLHEDQLYSFYWMMCLYMCARACDTSMAVPLLILLVQCTTGLTTFRTDELGMEV
jgi:hypothetical protein